MNFVKKTIKKIIKWACTTDVEEDYNHQHHNLSKHALGTANYNQSQFEGNAGLNLMVYSAIGGKVILVRHYNPINDRHNASMYIITDKEELGDELAQIITRENLSR